MNYYRRFPGDYGRDTKHLSMLEHAAYTLLLDHLYATEKPISSLPIACRICGATTKCQRNAVRQVLSSFFIQVPGGFSNNRFEKEVKHAESRRKIAKDNGKRGGRPKPTGLANGFVTESNTRLQTPEQSNSKERKPNYAPAAHEIICTSSGEVVPVALWLSFAEMRRKIRKPLTDHASEMIRDRLRWFQNQKGQDPAEILRQSIMNCWAGVFPLKGEGNVGESFQEKRSRTSAAAIKEIFGGDDGMAGAIHGALPAADK